MMVVLNASDWKSEESMRITLETTFSLRSPLGLTIDDPIDEDWTGNALLIAIRENYPSCVHYLIEKKANIQNSLSMAVKYKSIDCLRVLLENGANVNERQSSGFSVLSNAITDENLEIVTLLLQFGAKVKLEDDEEEDNAQDNSNTTPNVNPFLLACRCDNVAFMEILLQHGANVNEINYADGGRAAIHYAAEAGEVNKLELLHRHGANFNATIATDRTTALMIASEENHIDCVKFLVDHGADSNQLGVLDISPLSIACRNGHIECVKLLLSCPMDVDTIVPPAAFLACRYGQYSCLQVILDSGIDVNKVYPSLEQSIFFSVVQVDKMDCMELLLQYGADVNKLGCNGESPLYCACLLRNYKLVELLLSRGADINYRHPTSGMTPLHTATRWRCNICVEILLQHGAEVNVCAANGITPLHYACQNRHRTLITQLLEHGAKVIMYDTEGNVLNHAIEACVDDSRDTIDIIELLLAVDGVDVNAVGRYGKSILSRACNYSYLNLVQLLLRLGADPNQCDDDGNTPLMEAVRSDYPVKIMKLLLDYGADINRTNRHGKSVLYNAMVSDKLDVAEFLVSQGGG